jgi:ferritin-like metal-binding protein YciE
MIKTKLIRTGLIQREMQINTLQEELIDKLNIIYDIETHFLEAQQHMARQFYIGPLRCLLVQHIKVTQQQIRNLMLIFKLIDREPKPIALEAITTLIVEAQTLMQQSAMHPKILAAVIVEAQIKAKDCEIAQYRSVLQSIERLGQTVILSLIAENLQQEEQILAELKQYSYF